MDRIKAYKFILIMLIVVVSGCSQKLSSDVEIAKQHLEGMGYSVVSNKGEGEIQFLTSQLEELPTRQILGVQTGEVTQFLNKDIVTVSFMISNHPLDDMYNKGKTKATVFVIDNEVVGGWSLPHASQALVGGVYSLDGKTIEEVHGSNQAWVSKMEKAVSTKPIKVEKRADIGYVTINILETQEDFERLESFFENKVWQEGIEVQMATPPEYRFTLNGSNYAVWVTPLGDGLELVREGEGMYMKLGVDHSAVLYELMTGEAFLSE